MTKMVKTFFGEYTYVCVCVCDFLMYDILGIEVCLHYNSSKRQ